MSEVLHDDGELFAGLLQATATHLGIPVSMVEKDYYVSLILRRLAASDYREQIVFKGGTSLSKGYRLIDRFSEDVDFAVIHKAMSGNQVKMLLSKLMKAVTAGLAQGNRIKMPLPLRYGKDRLFLYCTGSSREGTLQAQVERHINHRYSHLSLWRRRLCIYV